MTSFGAESGDVWRGLCLLEAPAQAAFLCLEPPAGRIQANLMNSNTGFGLAYQAKGPVGSENKC